MEGNYSSWLDQPRLAQEEKQESKRKKALERSWTGSGKELRAGSLKERPD